MGTKYAFERDFTDRVHSRLAVPLIYKKFNWIPQHMDSAVMKNVDEHNGVDYFLLDMNRKKIITTQERFRESKYRDYNDFTIRFEREYNPNEDRRLSEYYKLNADYFVYGIINTSKTDVEKATGFFKYVVIDIKKLKALLDGGYIRVSKKLEGNVCQEVNGKMVCPVNYNKDRSSSFIPVDVTILDDLFSDTGVIVVKKGF